MEQGEEAQTTKDWLHRFVKALSEHSIRVVLARVANRLTLSTAGQTITVEVCSQLQQPRFFPVASQMQLPACASYDVFASRMNAALRLGEYMMRTIAQHEQRLTREEERAVAQAMGGEIRPGGYYNCGCGYVYAIGECGGPMQQATCPGCGSSVGGASHRSAGRNAHAGFDGARAPAWPQ
ncbi:TPA: NFX1-type zinc finger-containing protein 1 [Trebouxia sp. C0006]